MIDTADDQVIEKDAVELLLERRTHPTAQKLLAFHRANPTFFRQFAAEFFWLKKRKRPGAAEVLFQFLRGAKHWQGVDEFMVNGNIFPLLSRVCILLYPELNDGTLEIRQCEADEILGSDVVAQDGRKKGTVLRAREATRLELNQLPPAPVPPVVQRRSRRHRTVTAEEAAWVLPYIKELIARAPHPRNRVLQMLLRHAKTQPEVFALAERKLRSSFVKRPHSFSVRSVFTYARQTAQRIQSAEKKKFTLPHEIAPFYDRAAIRRNPQLNGWTRFKADNTETLRKGRANALLGCSLALEPVNGEPYRRLIWAKEGR